MRQPDLYTSSFIDEVFISLENGRKNSIIAGKGRFTPHIQTLVSKNHAIIMQ